MTLNMRCQYCSESKEVECAESHSASARCDVAKKHGWTAIVGRLMIPLYFCSSQCEFNYRVQTKTHLKIVGSVTR